MSLELNRKLRRFRWTWNNYEETTVDRLKSMTKNDCAYCTFGFEIAPSTGTPHLQGYIEFRYPITGAACKKKLDPVNGLKSSVCILACDASREDNIAYAQKTETKDPNRETPFIELNFRESTQGKRTDWHEMREFIEEKPDYWEFAKEYPAQAIKYSTGVKSLIAACKEARQVQEFKELYPEDSVLYTWQRTLSNRLRGKADDRKIIWFYDEKGNQGKSWIGRYLTANQNAAVFENASSKDIAHAYKGEPIVIFDFVRSNEERINYGIMESIKNGLLFSPKYDSTRKLFGSPWVVVMANFLPNMSACSQDRWEIHTLSGEPILENTLEQLDLSALNLTTEQTIGVFQKEEIPTSYRCGNVIFEENPHVLLTENLTACNIESPLIELDSEDAVNPLPEKYMLPREQIQKSFELLSGSKLTKSERKKLKRSLIREQTPPSLSSSYDP